MNFGIWALLVIGCWCVIAIVVSVTVGSVANLREAAPRPLELAESEAGADAYRRAS